jgi:NTE family protein
VEKVRAAGETGGRLLKERLDTERLSRLLDAAGRENWIPVGADDNYASILQRSFGIMNHTIARMGIELCPPDILVNLPFDSYHGVYGYSHAEEISCRGYALMNEALDRYESSLKA